MSTTETPAAEHDRPGVADAAKAVSGHASTLAGLLGELAQLEVKRKVAALGLGAALFAVAALLALYAIGFLLATIAAALATFLPTWLALLIVGVLLVLVAAGLVLLGRRSIVRGTPPLPELALEEARRTSEALKARGV